jgi:hypothetical protein
VRALITSLNPSEIEVIWQKTDDELKKIGIDYAKSNQFQDSTIKTGTNSLGKYVVVKGNKESKDTLITIEVYFYWGKKESIALTTVAKSAVYPTNEILTFLNSLKIKPDKSNLVQNNYIDPFEIVVFRDDKYPFAINYPSTWTKITPSFPETRIKAIVENADFSVTTVCSEEARTFTNEEFINGVFNNSELIKQLISKDIPNTKVISRKKIFLNNRLALQISGEGVHKNLEDVETYKIMQIVTLHKGCTYLLSFRSEKKFFDSHLSTFQFIASSFVIRNQ